MGYVDTLWDINITNITNIEKNMDFTSEIHGFHQWLNHRLPSEKFYPCHLHGDDDSPTTKIQKKGEFMGNLPSPVAALELSPFLLWCFV